MTRADGVGFIELARGTSDAAPRITVGTVDVRTPDGVTITRRYLHTPDVVAIVAVDGDELVLVREYRAAVGTDVVQVPMGKVDGGRDPAECARSELAEETGLAARVCTPVASVYTAPGWTNQVMHVFHATDLHDGPQVSPDDDVEEAAADVLRLPVAGFTAACRTGVIRDARTIAAVRLALD